MGNILKLQTFFFRHIWWYISIQLLSLTPSIKFLLYAHIKRKQLIGLIVIKYIINKYQTHLVWLFNRIFYITSKNLLYRHKSFFMTFLYSKIFIKNIQKLFIKLWVRVHIEIFAQTIQLIMFPFTLKRKTFQIITRKNMNYKFKFLC